MRKKERKNDGEKTVPLMKQQNFLFSFFNFSFFLPLLFHIPKSNVCGYLEKDI